VDHHPRLSPALVHIMHGKPVHICEVRGEGVEVAERGDVDLQRSQMSYEFAVIFSELIARLTTGVRGCFKDISKWIA